MPLITMVTYWLGPIVAAYLLLWLLTGYCSYRATSRKVASSIPDGVIEIFH
jgi:hypothetical protein